MIAAPKEGEAFTTGRGGAANVVTAGGEGDKPAPAETNGTGKKDVARYGLAYGSLGVIDFSDKLKYKLFGKKDKTAS